MIPCRRLREEVEEGDRHGIQDYLAWMEKEAARMDRLLTSALELSGIGWVATPPEELSFEEIALEALAQTEEAARSRGIEVSVAEGLPSVSVDRMRLVEALVNLVENSLKYAGDGPGPRSISISDIGVRGMASPRSSSGTTARGSDPTSRRMYPNYFIKST